MKCVVCAAVVATNTPAERELFRSTEVCSFQCVGHLKRTADAVNWHKVVGATENGEYEAPAKVIPLKKET